MQKHIDKLEAKKAKLEIESHKYDDRQRLCRTLYFSGLRRQVANMQKMKAIDMAIELLRGEPWQWYKIDIYHYAIHCISPQRYDYHEITDKARSNYLCDLKEVVKFIIDLYLPICKKVVLNILN